MSFDYLIYKTGNNYYAQSVYGQTNYTESTSTLAVQDAINSLTTGSVFVHPSVGSVGALIHKQGVSVYLQQADGYTNIIHGSLTVGTIPASYVIWDDGTRYRADSLTGGTNFVSTAGQYGTDIGPLFNQVGNVLANLWGGLIAVKASKTSILINPNNPGVNTIAYPLATPILFTGSAIFVQ